MKARRQIVSLFILLLAVYIGPVIAYQLQDDAIVPGHRIGKVALNFHRQSVHKLLGKPMGTYQLPHNLIGDYWQGNSGHTVRVFYQADKVIQVSITSPSFSTAEGLTVKSSLEDVQSHYKKLNKLSYFVHGSGGGLIDYYDDVKQGIAFEFTSQAMEPVKFIPYAIIVHRSGQKVIAESDEKPR
jgi:hypothetical protein